jgi:hypothetical protein
VIDPKIEDPYLLSETRVGTQIQHVLKFEVYVMYASFCSLRFDFTN